MPWIKLPDGREAWVPEEMWARPEVQAAIAAQGGVNTGKTDTKSVGSTPFTTGPVTSNLPVTNILDQGRKAVTDAVNQSYDAQNAAATAAQNAGTATPAPVDT